MKKIFKPRARMLLQLGDQLIKNENIAIVELVKNSYDADATECFLNLNNIHNKELASIVILDNGIGMVPKVVNEVWLEPGADFKELIVNGQLDLTKYGYEKSNRKPIGEKGIGRFGVHKLGNHIELVTKSKYSEKEVLIAIDWDEFSKSKYLEDAVFQVVQRTPKVFLDGRTGTRITVGKLRSSWTLSKYRDLYRTINSLNSPFKKRAKNEFEVDLNLKLEDQELQNSWSEATLSVDDIKKSAMWKFKCTISGRKITKIRYDFTPYKNMDLLTARTLLRRDFTEYDLTLEKLIKDEALDDVSIDRYDIGDIELEMHVFYLGTKVLKYGVSDTRQINRFMAENGGIRVYRDNMRVYNYGEREDDWLGLDQQRVSHVGQNIGNKLILGAASVIRTESRGLVEKTNREGFVENDAYLAFKNSILCAVAIFNIQRNIDKSRIRELYESSSVTQPVLHDVDRLTEITERLVEFADELPDEHRKKVSDYQSEILQGLQNLKNQYIETHQVLVKSAGAGLNLSVVVHEVEKRIKELERFVKNLDSDNFDLAALDKTKNLVLSIAKLISNYGSLVSGAKRKKNSLKDIVIDALFNCEFRFRAHKTMVINNLNTSKDIRINCSANIVIGAILNIFDNSLYWLQRYDIDNRKILISTKDYGDEVGLVITDNGKGFMISSDDAIKPFITTKKVGGMGLGLHIVDEMMKLQNGRLLIRDSSEIELPSDFSVGAVVELVFKK